jgi:hypothetical protein
VRPSRNPAGFKPSPVPQDDQPRDGVRKLDRRRGWPAPGPGTRERTAVGRASCRPCRRWATAAVPGAAELVAPSLYGTTNRGIMRPSRRKERQLPRPAADTRRDEHRQASPRSAVLLNAGHLAAGADLILHQRATEENATRDREGSRTAEAVLRSRAKPIACDGLWCLHASRMTSPDGSRPGSASDALPPP